jgi:hypothetical protein
MYLIYSPPICRTTLQLASDGSDCPSISNRDDKEDLTNTLYAILDIVNRCEQWHRRQR